MNQEQVLKNLRAATMFLSHAQEYADTGSELWLTCRRLRNEVDAVASLLADYSILLKIFDGSAEKRVN
jgi:hypothetical protein